jgi:tetratricopeptide (TPR) repeat protein
LYEESGVFQKNEALIEEMRQENIAVISQLASNVDVFEQTAINIQAGYNISDVFQGINNAPPIRAFDLYLTNLEFFRRAGDPQGEAATLYEMACLKTKQGNVKEATELFLKSLEIDERSNNTQGKASTLSMMGQLLSERGDTSEALNYLKEALAIFEQLKSPETDAVRDLIASLVYN